MLSSLSIHRSLLLIVVGITSVTMVMAAAVIYSNSRGMIMRQTIQALAEHNQGLAARLDAHLVETRAITRALAHTLAGQAGSPAALLWQPASNALQEPGSLIRRINVYAPYRGAAHQVLLFDRLPPEALRAPLLLLHDPDVTPALQTMLSSGAGWYPPAAPFFTEDADPVITVAAPYVDFEGQPVGLVWAEVATDELARLLNRVMTANPLARRGYGLLFTPDGLPLATYRLDTPAGSSIPQGAEVDQMAAWLATRADYTMLDQGFGSLRSALVTRSLLPQTGWQFVTVLPGDLIQSPLDASLSQVVLVVLGGIGLGGILARVFIRQRVTQPLRSLAAAAQEIGSGDLRYHISSQRRRDEIGQLARALADMRTNLAYSYDQLARWGRTLEKRVDERTRELESARQQAQSTAAELQAVYDASLSVISDYQLTVILQTLTERITGLLPANYAAVWLLTSDQQHLRMVTSTSGRSEFIDTVVPIDQGLVGLVVREAQPIIMEDYINWAGRLRLDNDGVEQALGVPLVFFNRPIGAVVAGRSLSDPVFTLREQRLMTLLANLVSPIVRNAQLYVRLGEAMDEANRANAVKTRFLASVTHELRTPLNLIINNLDFMRIGEFGPVNDEQIMRLGQTIRSAEHLLYLINDLLDVSKIEAGEMQLFIQMTDPYPMIEDALDSAVALIENGHAVTLQAEIPPALPPVPMDARRIRQVLTNLLSNAIKFTPQGDVSLRVELLDDALRFSVTDTGIGIPDEELDNLFRLFVRTDHARQMGIEGTGLGLAISRYLVEAHGGQMTVTTRVNQGSTFTFTVPRTQPDVEDEGKRVTAIVERLEM